MNYNERLKNVAILGAAGKMGSGIVWLLAIEMANLQLRNPESQFVLNAIDTSEEGLKGLLEYVRNQTQKYAEKNINELKSLYSHINTLEDNAIIQVYINDVLSIIDINTSMEGAFESLLVFEAVSENQSLKVNLFSQIEQKNNKKPWYFTNTSSVPIHTLNTAANLGGRILGFHFYNPPAVQKLVELITIAENKKEMIDFAVDLAKKINKILVPSNDIAGFIGNGFFMRDSLFGIQKALELSEQMPLYQAIYCVDKISREFLIRPMGTFQLMDYVGIDVMKFILQVMHQYIPNEKLHSHIIDEYVNEGIKGGQNSDGSQKDGFLKYENGRPVAVWCQKGKHYVYFTDFKDKADDFIGKKPDQISTWKEIIKEKDRENLLKAGFESLKTCKTNGCKLSVEYGKNAKNIAKNLLNTKVANNSEDINTVMKTGFFHAYGPINDFFE